MVWYSHLSQDFPQFIVIHTVKGFDIVNKAEIDVFLELSCFFLDPVDVGNLISASSAFSKTSLNIMEFNCVTLRKHEISLSLSFLSVYQEDAYPSLYTSFLNKLYNMESSLNIILIFLFLSYYFKHI